MVIFSGCEDFVHLRIQSSYSLLESTLNIDKIVEVANSNKMKALVLSDRDNLFGSLEFALAACKVGIQPIHGVILNLLYNTEDTLSSYENKIKDNSRFAEILLIAKDQEGFSNLLKLVSFIYTKNPRDKCNHITIEDLTAYNKGLILLTSYVEGVIGQLLLEKKNKLAVNWAVKFQEIFGDRLYFEIMRHNLEKEKRIEEEYINIAANLKIPLVATNQVLFQDVNSHDDHDVLLCISAGVTKEFEERKRASTECYFKNSKEMQEIFHDLPEAIENTGYLAQRCFVIAETHSPMLPTFISHDITEDELITKEANYGLDFRLRAKYSHLEILGEEFNNIKKKYVERLNYELSVICKMRFSGYFLIVSDFIKWSKKSNITVGPGRGSGAGSIVAWCLLITDLDPLEFGLLFERFLNPDRISMPDFDVDFCQERREEVIHYVRSKYGENRVGHIITFGKMQAKAVIKDVSRVLGLPYRYAEILTELVPFNAVKPVTLAQAINEIDQLNQAAKGKGLYEVKGEESLIQQVLKTALNLEGLPRHASTHAAGIVIAGKDLVDVVPVCKDSNSDMLIVQYSMKYAELAGLMKFDFLGLQTLTVITKCLALLKQSNIDIDFNKIASNDPKTYTMLSKGQSTGVFQFESVGMKDALRRLKPDCIDDIIALGALYRPGPMGNIPTYIACKNKLQEPEYLHPLMKPILEETHSVIIYQEQVMEIARTLAGFSLGEADLLRRAMGKKNKIEMAAQEEMFISGAKKNGITEGQAKSIFNIVEKFASYGFPKAHACAYGVISYQTAYLKANYTVEFLITCLNLELDSNDKINAFIQEAKHNSIPIVAPDINLSTGLFSISQDDTRSIIYALGAIKGVTVNLGNAVSREREVSGNFKNIFDFIERIPQKMLNKRMLENLIRAGCFDKINDDREKLIYNLSRLIAYSNSYHEQKTSDQFSLIKINDNVQHFLMDTKVEEVMPSHEFNLDEFNVLGLFINSHPLKGYEEIFKNLNIKNSLMLQNHEVCGFGNIKVAGVIQKKDFKTSNKGRFMSLQLSDQYGIFDITVFSQEVLKNYVHLLNIKTLVIVTCEIFNDEGGIRLTAKSFSRVSDIIQNTTYNIRLKVKDFDQLSQIIDILNNCDNIEKGNANINILLPSESGFVAKIDFNQSFNIEPKYFNLLKNFSVND